MKLTIIVTVYNEKSTILEAIEQARKLDIDKEIIVIDNCSTDGTREILKALHDPCLIIVYQSKNYGYGGSVITGMNLAKGDYVYVHNSDLEYDPGCVYEMLKLCESENLDAVFGSRLFNRKNDSRLKIIKERPFYLGTIITTSLANIFYGKDFSDIIGNRFYRVSALKSLDPKTSGVGFDFEVVSKLCKYGFRIKEVPVSYKPRSEGKKIKVWDIIPAVFTMIKVKFLKGKLN
jgi:glycosyltransferase involved in cell wall biosynthesis